MENFIKDVCLLHWECLFVVSLVVPTDRAAMGDSGERLMRVKTRIQEMTDFIDEVQFLSCLDLLVSF